MLYILVNLSQPVKYSVRTVRATAYAVLPSAAGHLSVCRLSSSTRPAEHRCWSHLHQHAVCYLSHFLSACGISRCMQVCSACLFFYWKYRAWLVALARLSMYRRCEPGPTQLTYAHACLYVWFTLLF
jgi:hypothetical protein